jgi:L-alanine-DL-glutamate epimerase-like enolase superfamily enzyme
MPPYSTQRIARLRLMKVFGTRPYDEPFWEERLVMPLDIYPEYRAIRAETLARDTPHRASSIFVELETDDGAVGRGGPIDEDQAYLIDRQLRPLIEGSDALAHERLWDLLYRAQIHGRKGIAMMAISAVDCAIWDLKGRLTGLPVHRLLGGPTRPTIPAYASALGYSVEPDAVSRRVLEIVGLGYMATKWFFVNGPTDGRAGFAANERLVAAVRESAGPDVDIMFDAWNSWDVPYTLEFVRRVERHRVRWLEEPVMPDRIESYAAIRRESPVPISGGEHEYTRWGLHALMRSEAVDVLQPDIYWAGGITEMLKICALASAYDLPVVPHGHSTPATVHLIASQPEPLMPILEYLLKWNDVHQFFLRDRIVPVDGRVAVPEVPGLGMDLDETRIEERRELRWG